MKILFKELSYQIQGAFYEIYKSLGSVFKESVYHNALREELKCRGIEVESQKRINVYYRGKRVGFYVPDFVIEEKIIVEMKAKPALMGEDIQQFWHYLKGSEYKVGYLVNFGKSGGVEFIRRVYDFARKTPMVLV